MKLVSKGLFINIGKVNTCNLVSCQSLFLVFLKSADNLKRFYNAGLLCSGYFFIFTHFEINKREQ